MENEKNIAIDTTEKNIAIDVKPIAQIPSVVKIPKIPTEPYAVYDLEKFDSQIYWKAVNLFQNVVVSTEAEVIAGAKWKVSNYNL